MQKRHRCLYGIMQKWQRKPFNFGWWQYPSESQDEVVFPAVLTLNGCQVRPGTTRDWQTQALSLERFLILSFFFVIHLRWKSGLSCGAFTLIIVVEDCHAHHSHFLEQTMLIMRHTCEEVFLNWPISCNSHSAAIKFRQCGCLVLTSENLGKLKEQITKLWSEIAAFANRCSKSLPATELPS